MPMGDVSYSGSWHYYAAVESMCYGMVIFGLGVLLGAELAAIL